MYHINIEHSDLKTRRDTMRVQFASCVQLEANNLNHNPKQFITMSTFIRYHNWLYSEQL